MRESKADLKKRVKKIIAALKKAYPDAATSLDFKNPLQLLIATMLSAQCTDKRVNIVTKTLFKKYGKVSDYAEADLKELERDIKSTGFYRNKAKNIKACCLDISVKFKGKVPDNMEELTSLAGVGRKTANVVLGSVFGVQSVVVDTHVKRISRRLGVVENSDPVKIEFELMDILPRREWTLFSHLLIFHGRAVCIAQRPRCEACVVNRLCEFYTVTSN